MTDVETAPQIGPAALDPGLAETLVSDLLFARRLSERMWNLQRQGRLTTVAPLAGQEAAVVGAVRGLDLTTDWLVPYYRDITGYGALGDEFVEQLLVYWRGHPDGGRIPDGVRSLPVQISLATPQVPHRGRPLRGDPKLRRRTGRRLRLHRRRRDVGGRLLRGDQPPPVCAAAKPLIVAASTTDGRSPPRRDCRPRPRRSRRRARRRGSPACASTATTSSRSSRRRARHVGARLRVTARRCSSS